jgi:hypothetical protein
MREGYNHTTVTAKLVVDDHPRRSIASFRRAVADSYKSSGTSDDLDFFKFVLVSEHANINRDYFLRSELIAASKTPIDKPFNIEHTIEESGSYISEALFNNSKNTIIGHMTDSCIAMKDGTVISEDELESFDKSDDFNRADAESIDLIASAVLYGFYFPKTVADVKKLANKGEMFVSMETWFKNAAYTMGDQVVEPSSKEESDALAADWHFGKKVEGKRMNRILKNILFGGVAATKNPANPNSCFVTASARKEWDALTQRHRELHIIYKVDPSDAVIAEHTQLMRTAANLKAIMEAGDAKAK